MTAAIYGRANKMRRFILDAVFVFVFIDVLCVRFAVQCSVCLAMQWLFVKMRWRWACDSLQRIKVYAASMLNVYWFHFKFYWRRFPADSFAVAKRLFCFIADSRLAIRRCHAQCTNGVQHLSFLLFSPHFTVKWLRFNVFSWIRCDHRNYYKMTSWPLYCNGMVFLCPFS